MALAGARLLHGGQHGRSATTASAKSTAALLGNAVEAWSELEPESEYWLDALFEGSFAFFLADEFSRALGNIHTLFSPYFRELVLPGSAGACKAVIFFYELPDGERRPRWSQQFHERYDPVQTELQA